MFGLAVGCGSEPGAREDAPGWEQRPEGWEELSDQERMEIRRQRHREER